MREKFEKVLDYLQGQGVDYADVRYVDRNTESITTEDLKLQELQNVRSEGVGIRVYLDGSMGFAGSRDLNKLKETADQALAIARASKSVQKKRVRLAQKEVIVDHYQTPFKIDPFQVSTREKLDLLMAAEGEMKGAAQLHQTKGFMDFQKEKKVFADTEGSYIVQDLIEAGGGIEARALGNNDLQVRSFPISFRGNRVTSGYEIIEELDLVENAAKTARETAELARAEECPSGKYDLVLDSTQLVLQIHESIGHPIELDRVFGAEAAYAGTSFVNIDMIDHFQYGSKLVNVVADATVPGGLGTFGYDDEGVPATRTEIITGGIFKNFLTSRDTASQLNQKSNGTSRADGWHNIPIVRMTNINLLPGNLEFEELLADIDYGLYFLTNKSWSIDDRRVNFQFGCEIAYEIKNGKLTGKIYKNPVYTGITPQFWNSCDGICNEDYWRLYGVPNCGKGQPGQSAHVGHGAAPARFRKVKVGVKDVK